MTQSQEILNHLQAQPITAVDALRLFGCFRLAARINDLRNMGHSIYTENVNANGKKYARYHLIHTKGAV